MINHLRAGCVQQLLLAERLGRPSPGQSNAAASLRRLAGEARYILSRNLAPRSNRSGVLPFLAEEPTRKIDAEAF
jgi:hypothetical protein